jgi:TRAP-type C4-dicarboxylate transport system permease large subunit
VTSRLAGVRIEHTAKWAIWFVFSMMVLLAILIAVPSITTWMPDALGY